MTIEISGYLITIVVLALLVTVVTFTIYGILIYRYNKTNCLCPKVCDCQNPEPLEGVAGVSNLCPIHNLYPFPDPDCSLHTGS